jgi:hypothetical protein
MAEVTLHKSGPHRLNKAGIVFERGVPRHDVPLELIRELENDERFVIKMADKDERIAARKAVVAADGRPDKLADRLEAIKGAIAELDIDVESNFTKSGLPDARALTAILGWQVTSNERDQAMAPSKPTGKITIRRKAPAEELLDSGADHVQEAAEDEEAVEV